jgi:hypothetical protein
MNDERVKFVEELAVSRKGSFEQVSNFVVAGFWVSESMTFEQPAGIGVDDEHGMPCRIEKY